MGTQIDKYESNHTGDGQTDSQKRTEVRTGKIYEFVRSNVMTYGVTEHQTLTARIIIDRFLHALTHRISLV